MQHNRSVTSLSAWWETAEQPHPQSADRTRDCSSGAERGSVPFAAQQWSHWTTVVFKPPPSKIEVSPDTSSLILWDCSSPEPCWSAEGSALQLLLFAHSSGSWRLHTHLAAKIRWNIDEFSSSTQNMFLSFTCLCCVRGGFTLDWSETPGFIYRVLNLHGDAFLLEQSKHWRTDSLKLCTCAQHQNLCRNKIKYVDCIRKFAY